MAMPVQSHALGWKTRELPSGCGYVGLRLAGGMSHWQVSQSNEEDQIESQVLQAEGGKQEKQSQVGQVNKEELEPKTENMSTWRAENHIEQAKP